MTIKPDWIVLDTNIWIFGLRKQPEYPACAQLLRQLYQWQIRVPRQILIELQANLSRDEVADLFRLLNHYPAQIDIRWDKAKPELVSKYLDNVRFGLLTARPALKRRAESASPLKRAAESAHGPWRALQRPFAVNRGL